MARDYKHMANNQGRSRKSPPWVWLLTGLAIGLFVAFLVYLGEHETGGASGPPQNNSGSSSAERREVITPGQQQGKLKGQDEPKPQEPRFEFYTILPEMEVQVHEATSPPRAVNRETHGNANQAPPRTAYVLQVGSFRRQQDADRLKAELALIGLQADIQVVSLGDKDTWHRVRLGPYKDLRALDETRNRLSEHNMRAIVLKKKN